MKYNKIYLGILLSVGILTPLQTMALTVIDDTDFPSSGISSSADAIDIITTLSNPTINISAWDAILASSNDLAINSANKVTINSSAVGNYNSSYGVRVLNSNLVSNSELEININDGKGIYLANKGYAVFNNEISINNRGTSANSFIGIMGYSSSTDGSSARFESDIDITSSGPNSMGIAIQNADNPQEKGSELTFNGKVSVNMLGDDSVGVLTQQMNNANPNSGAFILFNQGLDVVTSNGTTIQSSLEGGNITINGESSIISSNTQGGTFNAIEATAGNIHVNGKAAIAGNIEAIDSGYVDLNLLSGSSVTGMMDNYSVTTIPAGFSSQGGIDINMASGSVWNMTGDSYIDKLGGSGSVSYQTDGTPYGVLTVGDLSGSASFVMHADIVGDGAGNNQGDLLRVTGSTAGNHTLQVLNNGSAATDGSETLTLVETADGNGQFAVNNQVELGGYRYDLRQAGNNWELFGVGTIPEDPGTGTVPDKPKPEITTTADAGANFLNIGYLMNYAETQTLLQRMGDLRQNAEQGDMWLRGFAGKFDSFSGGKLSQFDLSYSGMQIGVDKRVSEQMPFFVGVFMGQTHGSPDYRSGDGTTKSSNAGIYGSYMASNGFYLDSVFKYSHLKNSFNVRDSQDNRVNGNGNSDGVSFSLEAGQKFNFTEQNNGFYIEPQLQLTYGHQDATQIKASNGLKVDLGSYESLMGRASTLFGYELNQGDNKINVYLKTGIVREFEGDVDYQLNGSTESHTFKGNWWNNGVGVSAQVAKQHTFYLDVDSSIGNKFDQRQINGGYRFSF